MAWFGFWIFVSTLLVCDTWLFSKGYNSFFWKAKTEAEQKIHKRLISGEQNGRTNQPVEL